MSPCTISLENFIFGGNIFFELGGGNHEIEKSHNMKWDIQKCTLYEYFREIKLLKNCEAMKSQENFETLH